mgnify:CR=1 FL=1
MYYCEECDGYSESEKVCHRLPDSGCGCGGRRNDRDTDSIFLKEQGLQVIVLEADRIGRWSDREDNSQDHLPARSDLSEDHIPPREGGSRKIQPGKPEGNRQVRENSTGQTDRLRICQMPGVFIYIGIT